MTGDDRDASARRLWRERSDSNRHGDSFKGCWPTIGPLSDNPSGKLQFTDCSSEPEPEGFEPPASPLRECSDRMSYVTMNNRPEGVVRVVERPGFEPGLSVLQTDVQTSYTIPRGLDVRAGIEPAVASYQEAVLPLHHPTVWCDSNSCRTELVAASRVELEERAYEARCATGHTPQCSSSRTSFAKAFHVEILVQPSFDFQEHGEHWLKAKGSNLDCPHIRRVSCR